MYPCYTIQFIFIISIIIGASIIRGDNYNYQIIIYLGLWSFIDPPPSIFIYKEIMRYVNSIYIFHMKYNIDIYIYIDRGVFRNSARGEYRDIGGGGGFASPP